MNESIEPEKIACPECGVLDIVKFSHAWFCTKQTVEEAVKSAVMMYEMNKRVAHGNAIAFQRVKKEIAVWQGKCAVLKHENNRLRKKLEGK